MNSTELPIVCDLNALSDRAAHETTTHDLLAQAYAVRRVEGGYEIDLPISALRLAAAFVDGERRCCRFLRFGLTVAPAADTLQFQISGSDAAQAFLTTELLPLLPVALAE